MSKKVVFRFDIDTHKCIREGVPNLLTLSRRYGVYFSFFINMGRAISLRESIKDLIKAGENIDDSSIEMMSAVEKLGNKEYIYTAVVNPEIKKYKTQIQELLCSGCEVGIHGGRNHSIWQKHALEWNREKIKREIDYSIRSIRKIKPDYKLKGFASPAWIHPDVLDDVLRESGFSYCADYHNTESDSIIIKDRFKTIGVNLLGEPGGVAFFENCRVKNYATDQIIDRVMDFIGAHEVTVLYDHPYYAGINELDCISRIIERIQSESDIAICTLEQLL